MIQIQFFSAAFIIILATESQIQMIQVGFVVHQYRYIRTDSNRIFTLIHSFQCERVNDVRKLNLLCFVDCKMILFFFTLNGRGALNAF